MQIKDHWLQGDNISRQNTPNIGGDLKPRFLIYHFTAGSSLESSVEHLCSPDAKASAHLLLGRDGRIVQLAPFNRVTWHAGVSAWQGLSGLNQYSIGIEMDNAGQLKQVGDHYSAWFGGNYPPDQVVMAAHKNGGGVVPWQVYTDIQIQRALELGKLLVQSYGLQDVLGHDDIAPGRKTDPGPAFPLASIRSRIFGREADQPQLFRVIADDGLNIRSGPGPEYPPVAPMLRKGTQVELLQAGDRWSKVEVVGSTDVEGWVNQRYLQAVG